MSCCTTAMYCQQKHVLGNFKQLKICGKNELLRISTLKGTILSKVVIMLVTSIPKAYILYLQGPIFSLIYSTLIIFSISINHEFLFSV